jgi:hypothetical protein
LRDIGWPGITVARLTPRRLSRCRRRCPLCSANTSIVSRRTSLRTRSHARSGRAGYGSADSCWNGSAVHTGGGKAWSITGTKQAVASALGRDARQTTRAGRTRRRPQLALADHPGLIPGTARILIRSCGTSPRHGPFTTRNRVGEAGPWWCSPIRVLTRSVLIKKRPQRMRGRNGRRDILRSDESR